MENLQERFLRVQTLSLHPQQKVIIYEDLNLLRYGQFTRKVSASSYIVPTSAAASYHSKRAYLELHEWAEQKYHYNLLEWGGEMRTNKSNKM
jgi:hypothetical protein